MRPDRPRRPADPVPPVPGPELSRRRLLTLAAAAAMPAARVDAAPVDAAPVDARNDLIGRNRLHIVRPGDTLVDIAVAYRVGFVELAAANPAVDRWLPRPGTEVVIPQEHILPAAPRRGIVINLAELRLYHFGKDGEVASMPIGIGSEGLETPDGETTITGKRKNPTWWPPPSIRAEKPELPKAVPPGPDNPLGDYALELGWPLYRIHGTNLPYGVGRRVSHGCIRMYPADIETVFNSVRIGTPVTVVDQPVKVGWQEGRLFLEAHPTQRQADEIEAGRSLADWPPTDPIEAIRAGVGDAAGYVRIDWTEVRRIAEAREGVPGLISIGSVRLPSE